MLSRNTFHGIPGLPYFILRACLVHFKQAISNIPENVGFKS